MRAVGNTDTLHAVLIADSFHPRISALLGDRPLSLLPLVGRPLIEYALTYLRSLRVDRCIVYVCRHRKQLQSYLLESGWLGVSECGDRMTLQLEGAEDCHSLGDIMRDLDAKSLVQSDFILIGCDCICNIDLLPLLKSHSALRCGEARGLALTVLALRDEPRHRSRRQRPQTVMALDSKSGQVLFHRRLNYHTPASLKLPRAVFEQHDKVEVRYDLCDANIWLCSPCLPQIFSDNFDFQTMDHFIRGVIMNEEITGNTIFCTTLNSGYLASIDSIAALHNTTWDIVQNRNYPVGLSLPVNISPKLSCSSGNIHRHSNVETSSSAVLERDIVLASGVSIADKCRLNCVVVGEDSSVGQQCFLRNVLLGQRCSLGNNISLQSVLMGDDVHLEDGVDIGPYCVIGSGVRVKYRTCIPGYSQLIADAGKGFERFGHEESRSLSGSTDSQDQAFDPIWRRWGDDSLPELLSDTDESISSGEGLYLEDNFTEQQQFSEPCISRLEDDKLFYGEVLDSMMRAFNDKVTTENLLLEVNSSKFAYNVSSDEVIESIVKALLAMPNRLNDCTLSDDDYWRQIKTQIAYFQPLIAKYIKDECAMQLALKVIELDCFSNIAAFSSVARMLHLLYDIDIFSEKAILSWYRKDLLEHNETAANNVRKQVAPLVDWLENAEEESD